jgi:hypothetical protein
MRRLLPIASLVVLALLSGGCALCCAPFDCDYPYVGGRWVRTNPSSGRVASLFDEAGAPVEAVPTAGQPASPPPVPPATRSVIPRNLGETYLP